MFFLPTKMNIGAFKLNNIDHLSSISFSSTIKKNRNVCAKKNQGFGQQMADNTLKVYSKSSVIDNDIEDSYTGKSNI
jgi:hypothetical protein